VLAVVGACSPVARTTTATVLASSTTAPSSSRCCYFVLNGGGGCGFGVATGSMGGGRATGNRLLSSAFAVLAASRKALGSSRTGGLGRIAKIIGSAEGARSSFSSSSSEWRRYSSGGSGAVTRSGCCSMFAHPGYAAADDGGGGGKSALFPLRTRRRTCSSPRRRITGSDDGRERCRSHLPFLRSYCTSNGSTDGDRDGTTTGEFDYDGSSSGAIPEEDRRLAELVSDAYDRGGETDGILDLARTLSSNPQQQQPPSAQELVRASLRAAGGNRGKAGSIVTAWVGWCVVSRNPQLAADLLRAIDNSNTTDEGRSPSLYAETVTLCLAYTALLADDFAGARNGDVRTGSGAYSAEAILDRAAHMAKKKAGSKRRKAMAAARGRGKCNGGGTTATTTTTAIVEEQVRQLLASNDFSILYEDDNVLVVNKPSGVSCYHCKSTTAGKVPRRRRNRNRNRSNRGEEADSRDDFAVTADVSLVDAILACGDVPLSTLNAEARGIVHRLDRGTSGCIALAKTDDAHARLVTEFYLRRTRKEYTALTSPAPASRGDDGDDAIELESCVDGRPAKSTYRLLERFAIRNASNDATASAALGLVKTRTGRKHQVRVHCAELLKSPVVLDDLYGRSSPAPTTGSRTRKKKSKKNSSTSSSSSLSLPQLRRSTLPFSNEVARRFPRNGFFLHASSLSVPSLGIHSVEAPLPDWWQSALDELRRGGSET